MSMRSCVVVIRRRRAFPTIVGTDRRSALGARHKLLQLWKTMRTLSSVMESDGWMSRWKAAPRLARHQCCCRRRTAHSRGPRHRSTSPKLDNSLGCNPTKIRDKSSVNAVLSHDQMDKNECVNVSTASGNHKYNDLPHCDPVRRSR